ncbi:MAG: dihydrofolate reductase [Hyphomicrobiaceae bacterium]
MAVAVARNGVIGKDGGLPWRLSSDLKTFRRLTMGKPLVMGRRTFASLGKPLDGRDNLVVTRDRSFKAEGAEIFPTLDAAIARAHEHAQVRGVDEIAIIGGADIYRQILPAADRMYWTEVEANVDGDTCFPDFDRNQWRETAREPIPQGPKDDYPATLITLDRI